MKPTIPEVLPLVNKYVSTPGNELGGSLHIILEDCNVADRDARFCLEDAESNKDMEGIYIARKLMEMSRTQRTKIARSWTRC